MATRRTTRRGEDRRPPRSDRPVVPSGCSDAAAAAAVPAAAAAAAWVARATKASSNASSSSSSPPSSSSSSPSLLMPPSWYCGPGASREAMRVAWSAWLPSPHSAGCRRRAFSCRRGACAEVRRGVRGVIAPRGMSCPTLNGGSARSGVAPRRGGFAGCVCLRGVRDRTHARVGEVERGAPHTLCAESQAKR